MEFIGTVQFFNKNGKRSNPLSLYLEQLENAECRISIRLPEWRHIVGIGATPNKAAGDFELKLKQAVPEAGAYDGPAWNGIKAEKPPPPKPPPAPAAKPAGAADAASPAPAPVSKSADAAQATPATPAVSAPSPVPAAADPAVSVPAKDESSESA